MDEYDIYIERFAGPGADAAESGLSRVFGLDPRRAREFVQSLPRVVKRSVPAARVAQYERVLQELGAEYTLRRSAIRPQQIITVASAATTAGVDPELHGSTLTLTLSVPPPAPAPSVPPQPAAPETAAAPAPSVRSASQFSTTVVDPLPPYGLMLEAEQRAASASAPPPAPAVSPESPAWTPPAEARVSSRVGQGTLSDGTPSSDFAASDARSAQTHRALASPWPPPPDVPSRSDEPEEQVRDPVPVAAAWSSLQLDPRAAASSQRPSPARPRAAARNDLPEAWQVPGLSLDGGSRWLTAGEMHEPPKGLASPAGSAPSVGPGPGDGAIDLDESAAAQPNSPRNRVRAPRLNANDVAAATPGIPIRGVPQAPTFGLHTFPSHEDKEPSALLRLLLRAGLGISLFVLLTAVRHCRAFNTEVDDALAGWGEQPSAELAVAETGEPARASSYGPRALPWMESDLHQFSSGDKDRARAVALRYKRAGALEVYVGSIMRSGPVLFAGELIVELPSEPAARKAVLAEHRRVLEAAFGGFAPEVLEPGGPILRVTL